MLEGAQLAGSVAVVSMYVRQDTILLLILMHNNCKEKARKAERVLERERQQRSTA